MNICPSCGTGFQNEEEFCLDCGLKLTMDGIDPPATPRRSGSGLSLASADVPRTTGNSSAATSPTASDSNRVVPKARLSTARSRKRSTDRPGESAAHGPDSPPAPIDSGTDRQMHYRPIYKAPDEWTAVTIKELLCSAGLTAQVVPVPGSFEDGIDRLIEGYWGKVLVLESDVDEACSLIGDYLRGLDRSMH